MLLIILSFASFWAPPADSLAALKGDAMTQGMTVTLTQGPPNTARAANLVFTVSAKDDQRFCIWQTPLEGITADIFDIRDPSGTRVPYTGIMVKRREPGPSDYQTVGPNAPVSKSFNLAEDYELTAKGKYTVVFRGNPSLNTLPDSNVLQFELR